MSYQRVEFALLGAVAVRADGVRVDVGHARQRCVLAALLVDANRAVPADVLVDRVWGDRPPQRRRNTVAGYVSRLRGLFSRVAGVRLERRPEGYRLDVDHDAVDLFRFRRLVGEARRTGDDEAASALFDGALGLWRGEPFAGLDTRWLAGVRVAVEEERLAATLDRNEVALRLGRHAGLLGELVELAGVRPLDERLAGQLMLVLYRCGRQADALRRYEAIRVRLAEELGIDPGPDLAALHRAILRADPALTETRAPAAWFVLP